MSRGSTRFPGSRVGRHRSLDQNICPGTPGTLRSTIGNASADTTEQQQTAPARDPLSHISPLGAASRAHFSPGAKSAERGVDDCSGGRQGAGCFTQRQRGQSAPVRRGERTQSGSVFACSRRAQPTPLRRRSRRRRRWRGCICQQRRVGRVARADLADDRGSTMPPVRIETSAALRRRRVLGVRRSGPISLIATSSTWSHHAPVTIMCP